MRFFTLASALLASSSAVLAAPATEQQNQCCCCDILAQQVVCVAQAKPNECICAQVMCPSNAPTVYASGAPGATTVVPASLTSEYAAATQTNAKVKAKRQVDVDTEVHPQCCCCNANLGSIVCTNTLDANNCSCSSDKCPDGAPTIHAGAGASATPTPPPKAHPLVGPIVIRDDNGSDDYSDPDAYTEHHERDEEYIDYFGANEHHERDVESADECCHCDFVARQNICTQSKQCPYPKIDNCIFETIYV